MPFIFDNENEGSMHNSASNTIMEKTIAKFVILTEEKEFLLLLMSLA